MYRLTAPVGQKTSHAKDHPKKTNLPEDDSGAVRLMLHPVADAQMYAGLLGSIAKARSVPRLARAGVGVLRHADSAAA